MELNPEFLNWVFDTFGAAVALLIILVKFIIAPCLTLWVEYKKGKNTIGNKSTPNTNSDMNPDPKKKDFGKVGILVCLALLVNSAVTQVSSFFVAPKNAPTDTVKTILNPRPSRPSASNTTPKEPKQATFIQKLLNPPPIFKPK